LTHAGKISHDLALNKARQEYEKYRKELLEQPTEVENHFIEAEKIIKQIDAGKMEADHSNLKSK